MKWISCKNSSYAPCTDLFQNAKIPTMFVQHQKRTMYTKIVLFVEIVAFRLAEIRRVLFPLLLLAVLFLWDRPLDVLGSWSSSIFGPNVFTNFFFTNISSSGSWNVGLTFILMSWTSFNFSPKEIGPFWTKFNHAQISNLLIFVNFFPILMLNMPCSTSPLQLKFQQRYP